MLALVVLLFVIGCGVRRRPYPGKGFGLSTVLVLLILPIPKLMSIEADTDYAEQAKWALTASRGEDYSPMVGTPYWMYRHPIMDHDGLPCAKMPWVRSPRLTWPPRAGAIHIVRLHRSRVDSLRQGKGPRKAAKRRSIR